MSFFRMSGNARTAGRHLECGGKRQRHTALDAGRECGAAEGNPLRISNRAQLRNKSSLPTTFAQLSEGGVALTLATALQVATRHSWIISNFPPQ